jgi:vacuolar-type H+-ATPase subunit B/Vma2
MLNDVDIRGVATNLRKLASDPLLKKRFTSETRKDMNDLANTIMAAYPSSDVPLVSYQSERPK